MGLKNKLFLGTFVHSKALDELEYLHNAAVCVDMSGTIVAVEVECDELRARETVLPRLGWEVAEVEVVEAKEGQFFFPGFIDTHLHASQYPNIGIFGKSTLLDWLNTYTFPLEASLSDPVKARQVYTRVIRKTLSHGTTCAAYYATIDVPSTNLLTDLCLSHGQRALVGRVCMDQLSPDYYRDASADASLAATRASIAHILRADPTMSLVKPIITPRFAPACSLPLMRQLGALARETSLPIQTHISENKSEIALVKDLFPPSATGAADDSYASVYDAAGLLTDKTVLAHAVHLTEAEADLVSARRAKVSHCPCSNSAITSGAARVRWLLDKGITCGLGTDMSGGYSPSVLETARQAALVSRHVVMGANGLAPGEEREKLSVEEVLFLATRGGAEVVGLEGRVGGFEVGMEWDAQLVGLGMIGEGGEVEGEEDEGGDVDVFGWESWPDRVAKWLYNGDDRNTKKVWVKGRLVHQRK
ncbi:Metallo-dependent hydrolase [Parathielavia appendiculata]|uniref:Probable guanine deaminase n=1 Tax=Parathielavia appendiculata TaxID=2587402 RepID=A0AAN6U3V4_9PEZI|nr:Metallo-dependent hydrolase [Parathielavia appendiculata]